MNNWYGFEKGNNQYSLEKLFPSSDEPHNQTELAESYGITKQTMNNYMRMASMIPIILYIASKNISKTSPKYEGFYMENYANLSYPTALSSSSRIFVYCCIALSGIVPI